MKTLLFTIFLCLSVSYGSFAQIETRILSPKKMQKDLEFFLENIDGHPDPYTKISEEDFNAIVEEVRNNLNVELDEIDFYKNLTRIISTIHDGHTSVYFPEGWLERIRKEHGVFPYEVYLTDDEELFVIDSHVEDQIPLGAQVLEINGMSVTQFIKEVTPHISYEVLPFRNDRISRSFELMLYLVFKQSDQLNFKVKYLKEEEFIVSNIDFKEWKNLEKDDRERRDKKLAIGEPYDFTIIKPGVAKIDIFSFSVRSISSYEFFLAKTFKTIQEENIHSLIIDVRGNYGGYPKVSSMLFQYIHEGYFKTMAKSTMKISSAYRSYFTDKYPELLRSSYRGKNNLHSIDLHEVIKGKLNTYVDEESFYNETPVTKDYEFLGDCYLLTDRKSFSASSGFASTFQCYSMGYIVGEPTGGTKIFRANAFARKMIWSRFWVRVSSTKLWTTCYDQEDQGVIPNVEVKHKIIDLVHKNDAQLNTALWLIKEVQAKKAAAAKAGNED